MGLREYKKKRHFDRTPEPAGKVASAGGRSFVVQKHQASHLHYDFRLELGGVLKSWAVPKGPSLDPSVKRLAMHVEDHPVEYGDFEGIIPAGEYGGGTVMVWDSGEWEPLDDGAKGYWSGRLKFRLHGQKLRGAWMLVRTGGGRPGKDQRHWLLIKEKDDEARPTARYDVAEELPLSATTGRSLEEIAADPTRVWRSNRKSGGIARKHPGRSLSAKALTRTSAGNRKLPGKKTRSLPTRVEVQLATLAKEAPAGDDWLHEIKFDGYRMVCRVDGDDVRFLSRNHRAWTSHFPSLVIDARRLGVRRAILDGEVVVLRPDGTTSFQDLQNLLQMGKAPALYYFAFDLLHLDGHDLTGLPLVERKRLLADLLGGGRRAGGIQYSEHIEGNGPAFFKQACRKGLEGIISKRGDQPYRPGRGQSWLKVKCVKTGEFVVGGYTEPTGSRARLGALHVGFHDARGGLVYAGKIGTGFKGQTLEALYERLSPLERATSPFADLAKAGSTTHWVEPRLVVQATYGEWTEDGRLRHPSFQGIREDKAASEVTREMAIALDSVRTKATRTPVRAPTNGRLQKSSGGAANGRNGYDERKQQLAGVRLTTPNKVLYPDSGITKIELARYSEAVADWILPHIKDRPLVLVRCPEGQHKECFYQKHPGVGTPDTLRRVPVREKTKTEEYVVVDDVRGLIALSQISALEIHAWGSRTDNLDKPDKLIFDLDPDPSVPWKRVVQSAVQVRAFLKDLGLESFVKTTGGKGLHLVVPVARRHGWDEAKAFCKRVADAIVAADPRHYTANMSKAARTGKIFIDYLRNDRGSTAIVAYSTRARPGAPVSVPLTWKELSAEPGPALYSVRNLLGRLSSLKSDPWDGFAARRQSLAPAIKTLERLFAR